MSMLAFDVRTDLVLPLSNGIFDGCAYGLLALGLVLLYKSNRIFNFAQGEFASVAGIVAYVLDQTVHLPYFVAIGGGILASVLVAALTQLLVIRPMFNRPRVVLLVGTVGVALLLIGLEGALFPKVENLSDFTGALHLAPVPGRIDGVPLSWVGLAKVGVLALLAVAAFLFFRYTATGSAVLAVSQDPDAARGVGIRVERLSLLIWSMSGLLGGVAGVLFGMSRDVAPGSVTGLALTPAFAAAVFGGMTSLPGAFLGGVLLGVFQDLISGDAALIPGLRALASPEQFSVFVLLLVVLLVRPRGLLGKEA